MESGPEVPAPAADNPAAAADAEQHALQEIAGMRARGEARARVYVWPAVAVGAVVSGWLLRRLLRRRSLGARSAGGDWGAAAADADRAR